MSDRIDDHREKPTPPQTGEQNAVAETALQKEKEKFAKAFYASPSAISISRLSDGYVVEVNDRLLEILNYRRDEVLGHTTTEFNLWADPEERRRVVDAIREQGGLRNIELKLRAKTAEILTVGASLEIIELEGVAHILGMFQDITAQKLLEAERAQLLDASRRRARELTKANSFVVTLSQVAARVADALDVDEVLATLGKELEGLGFHCLVAMTNDDDSLGIRYFSLKQDIWPLLSQWTGLDPMRLRLTRAQLPDYYDQVVVRGQARFGADPAGQVAAVVPWLDKPVLERLLLTVDLSPSARAISIPFAVDAPVTGLLVVWGLDLDPADVPVFAAVGAQVAAAMKNARRLQAEREQRHLAESLRDAAIALNGTQSEVEVLDQILAHLRRFVPHDAADIMLIDEGVARAVSSTGWAERGLEEWLMAQRYRVRDEPLHRQVAASGQAQVIPDMAHSPDWSIRPSENWVRSMAVAPIIIQEQTRGFLRLVSATAGFFRPEHGVHLQTFAHQAAAAIHNAELYAEREDLIEERERTQNLLVHSEKMAAVGRLAASLAHEINNPLQAIQGCLGLAKEELRADRRLDKIERYLEVAAAELDRIAGLASRMRDYYRPKQSGRKLVSIQAILDLVLDLTARQLESGSIKVKRDLAPDLPEITADPDELKQVFLNIVLNAMDAMPQGGALAIGARIDYPSKKGTRPISGRLQALGVRIEFADTGSGMSTEALARLFEPFITSKEHGSGLGLYISYNIIQMHDGKITAASDLGRGTTFSIWLPINAADAQGR